MRFFVTATKITPSTISLVFINEPLPDDGKVVNVNEMALTRKSTRTEKEKDEE
ncbi:MAG: hypothetical protein ACOX00_06465 [Peptoniphilaceae bacterium]|jgi:hypothetical protein